MPINPNIIAGIDNSPIPMRDPMERFSKGLQLKQMMQAGQQQDQAIADEKAVREAYQQSGGDIGKLRQLLSGGGQYRQLQALEKTQLDTDKARVGIDKDKYDITAKAIAQHRDQLANVTNPEQAAQWVMAGIRDPYTGPIMSKLGDPQAMIARIPTDPAGFEQWKKQSALGATKFIEMNKPHINVQDTGASSNVIATPGLGGAPSILSSTPKQQSPDSRAADFRAQQTKSAEMAKPPAGYAWGPKGQDGNPTLIAVKGGPADLKLAGALNQDTQALSGSMNSFDRLATAANEVLNHPGLAGISGIRGAIPNIPGTQAADAQALLGTLKSQVGFGVLQDMRNNSKTGGALGSVSDAEGKRLEANLAALDKSQSIEQFKSNLKKIIDYSEGAKQRLRDAYNLKHGEGSVNPVKPGSDNQSTEKPATEFNSLPDPAQFKGRRIQGPSGIMRSNGTSWVMERG